jgi:hypothetical protein
LVGDAIVPVVSRVDEFHDLLPREAAS